MHFETGFATNLKPDHHLSSLHGKYIAHSSPEECKIQNNMLILFMLNYQCVTESDFYINDPFVASR